MVMQPTFIFGAAISSQEEEIIKPSQNQSAIEVSIEVTIESAVEGSSTDHPQNNVTSLSDIKQQEQDYLLGVTACLVVSITAAMSNVLSASSKGCPMPITMMIGGAGALIISLICPFVGDNFPNRFIQPASAAGALPGDLPLIGGVAMASLVGGLLVIYACQVAPPSLVAIVRSSEIVLAIFADYVIFKTTEPQALHIAGALVTLMSVAMMAAADWIQAGKVFEQVVQRNIPRCRNVR